MLYELPRGVLGRPACQCHIDPLRLLLPFNPCVSLPFKAVDLKTPPGAVYRGPPKDGVKPGCTLTISDEDFVSIASGKLSAQKVCKLSVEVGVGWVGVQAITCYSASF